MVPLSQLVIFIKFKILNIIKMVKGPFSGFNIESINKMMMV